MNNDGSGAEHYSSLVSNMKFANVHRRKQNFKFHKQKTASDSGKVLHYERQDGGFEVGSSSATVSLRDYKTFASFNAETKEKSSGTCEHVIQSRKENSMEGY